MSSSDGAALTPDGAASTAPRQLGRIEVWSQIQALELAIVASDLTPIAVGNGRIEADVEPGIYEVVARAGPIVDRDLVKVDPGATVTRSDVQVAFPSAAPIEGTSTFHESHASFVSAASGSLARSTAAGSGLVLSLRDVRGAAGPAIDPSVIQAFSLFDATLTPVTPADGGWQVNAADRIAAWSQPLPPGGYILRATAGTQVAETVERSIWLAPGWQTLVFVTTGDAGPDVGTASVAMTDLGSEWLPWDRNITSASELCLWGLREGRAVVPDDLLGVALNGKFRDPMLGILGAHALLLRRPIDGSMLDTVLTNLEGLVPGHPDVLALRRLQAEQVSAHRRLRSGVQATRPWSRHGTGDLVAADAPRFLPSTHPCRCAGSRRDRGWVARRAGRRAPDRAGRVDDVAADRGGRRGRPHASAARGHGGCPAHAVGEPTGTQRVHRDGPGDGAGRSLPGDGRGPGGPGRCWRSIPLDVAAGDRGGDDAAGRERGPCHGLDRDAVAAASSPSADPADEPVPPVPEPPPPVGPSSPRRGEWLAKLLLLVVAAAALLVAGVGTAMALGLFDGAMTARQSHRSPRLQSTEAPFTEPPTEA